MAARRSAVVRARLPACRAACLASKAPPNPAGPPRQAAARRTSATGSPGSPPQQQARFHPDAPSHRGHQRSAVGPCWARVRGPTRRPRRRPRRTPRQRASRLGRGPRLLRAKSSDPHINRVLTVSGTYSPCRWNTWGGQRHGVAYVGANPRPQCRAHASRIGQRRLRFACVDRMQPVARQRGSVQPVAACAVRCDTVHSVATQRMWLQHSGCGCNMCAAASHLCCAEADVPEGSSGDADVGLGMDSVAVQMWARAWTLSQCSCGWVGGWVGGGGGGSFALVQRWARDRLSPFADVGGGWTWSRCRGGLV
jgi:hypothetical protein